MKLLSILKVAATFGMLTSAASSAELTLGDRVLVSTNNANFDISVFPGAASYNDRGVSGTEPGTVSFTNLFGEGTVLDYNFFHSPNQTIASYAKGEAGLIGDATSPAANIDSGGENWSNVWTTGPINADLTTKDFTNASVPNTFARSANITGTIDITGLQEGTIYIPHGSFNNGFTLTLTMTGAGQPDLTSIDTIANGVLGNTNNAWITDFTFDNAGDLYDTITYSYTNLDIDGSRARFMGVILVSDSSGPSKELQITDITHARASAPDNVIVNLTFNSSEGTQYTILTSVDLALPIAEWTVVENAFDGAVGADFSTFTVDYNNKTLPLTEKQFFIVSANAN